MLYPSAKRGAHSGAGRRHGRQRRSAAADQYSADAIESLIKESMSLRYLRHLCLRLCLCDHLAGNFVLLRASGTKNVITVGARTTRLGDALLEQHTSRPGYFGTCLSAFFAWHGDHGVSACFNEQSPNLCSGPVYTPRLA